MSTAPGDTHVGVEPAVDDLATDFVAAVCHPGDVPAVLDTLERVDPADLAGLVAAVDDHQPMTLEVVVDVLAELGVAAPVIAAAVGVDAADVRVLLGPAPAAPRPSLGVTPSRVIDVSRGRPGDVDVTAADHTVPADDDVAALPGADLDPSVDAAVATPVGAPIDDPVDDPDEGVLDGSADHILTDDGPAAPVVRIESDGGAEDDGQEHGDGTDDRSTTVISVDDPSSRARVWFAVVLFVLLVGGAVALAWLVGAFQ